jgi:hypothetical protein
MSKNLVSPKQRQRNLENIAYVRSLLHKDQESDNGTQTRSEDTSLESSQETDPGA